jgi:hypothetical protein
VQRALDEASKSRTTVCIAHRLSTIKNADKIIVMSRGEIVEQGTHAQLIAHGGVYQGLVEAQRISSEKVEGVAAASTWDEDEEELDEIVRHKTTEEEPGLEVSRTKTGRSVGSIEAERPGFESAGLMPQTKYSNFQLVKKVYTPLFGSGANGGRVSSGMLERRDGCRSGGSPHSSLVGSIPPKPFYSPNSSPISSIPTSQPCAPAQTSSPSGG